MALTDSFPGPNGLTDSIEAGKDLGALIRHNADGSLRAGLTYRPAGSLVTGRSDLRVNVAPFKAVLVRQGAARLLANDAAEISPDFTVPAANSRIDVLYLKVGEVSLGDATDGPFFGILEGAPAPIPTKPALSIEGAFELATVQIPSTATGTTSAGVTIINTAATSGVVGGSGLPAPVTAVAGAFGVPTAGTSAWTDSGWAGFTLTLDEACWVELDLQAWIAVTGSGNDVRADLRVQGATTVAAQSAGWGAIAYGGVGATKSNATKKVLLNAGANQIRLSLFRTVSSSGTFNVSQSTVTVTPLRSA